MKPFSFPAGEVHQNEVGTNANGKAQKSVSDDHASSAVNFASLSNEHAAAVVIEQHSLHCDAAGIGDEREAAVADQHSVHGDPDANSIGEERVAAVVEQHSPPSVPNAVEIQAAAPVDRHAFENDAAPVGDQNELSSNRNVLAPVSDDHASSAVNLPTLSNEHAAAAICEERAAAVVDQHSLPGDPDATEIGEDRVAEVVEQVSLEETNAQPAFGESSMSI